MLEARSIWKHNSENALRVCRYFLPLETFRFACRILIQITARSHWRAPKLTLHQLTRLLRHQA